MKTLLDELQSRSLKNNNNAIHIYIFYIKFLKPKKYKFYTNNSIIEQIHFIVI